MTADHAGQTGGERGCGGCGMRPPVPHSWWCPVAQTPVDVGDAIGMALGRIEASRPVPVAGQEAREGMAQERLAVVLALHTAHLCSCGGRRWTEDQNWSPEHYERGREREEGSGLIPCGFCNHGGWSTEQWDKDGAVSCNECDQDWPCPTVLAAGGQEA